MSQTNQVKCDQCGEDITYTGNSEDYRIVLGSQGKSAWFEREGLSGGAMTDMAIPDPFPITRHFCNTVCLAMWIPQEFPNAQSAWDRQVRHRAWLAEKMSTRVNNR